MAGNDIYVIDTLATPGGPTVTASDDGGIDEIRVTGVYEQVVDITLSWSWSINAEQAAGTFYINPSPDNTSGRLVVNGIIENARGSNGRDNINGNPIANTIFGDAARTGPGGNDVLSGADGNDIIYGGAGDDNISGGGHNDRLFGDAGVDTISGGGGIDTVQGGLGADILSGGASLRDTVAYSESTSAVNVKITFGSATTGLGGHAAGDQITGFSDVVGSKYNDLITDTVKGTIAFNYNQNIFRGGAGNDRLYLGGGNDTGHGEAGNDSIYGEAGNDILVAGAGNDILNGGLGIDSLSGGANNDSFIFNAPVSATNRDTINDFIAVQDTMRLENAVFTKAGVPGTLKATAFKLSTQVKDGDDRIIYNKASGALLYDPDGSGAAAAVHFATLSTKPTISHLDFVVI